MRKTFVLSGWLVALLLLAVPASAQTDPFDPLLEEGSTGTESGGGTGGDTISPDTTTADPTDTSDTTDPTVVTEPASDEPLPGTGADPSNWIVVAGILMAVGAGLVAISRLMDPPAKYLAVRSNRLDGSTD